MAIKFAEAVLGMSFRVARPAQFVGPDVLPSRRPARAEAGRVFAGVAGLAALLTTPFTQPNSMAVVLESQFGVPTWAAGIAIAV